MTEQFYFQDQCFKVGASFDQPSHALIAYGPVNINHFRAKVIQFYLKGMHYLLYCFDELTP